MTKASKRLREGQWRLAVDALRHVEADWECWESDGDPSATTLLDGIKILRMLIDDRRPSDDWDTLSEPTTKERR